MKKIIIILVGLGVLYVGWVLISPLFINMTVDEAVPVQFIEVKNDNNTSKEENNETSGLDIAVDSDIVVSEAINDMPVGSEEMSTVQVGTFVGADSSHQGSGDVKIIRDMNKTFLRFENFSVTNGPDLFVTLNKGDSAETEHIIVSALKGNKGNQNYDVSEYNLDDYDSVSIYCRAFSVEFATASL